MVKQLLCSVMNYIHAQNRHGMQPKYGFVSLIYNSRAAKQTFIFATLRNTFYYQRSPSMRTNLPWNLNPA